MNETFAMHWLWPTLLAALPRRLHPAALAGLPARHASFSLAPIAWARASRHGCVSLAGAHERASEGEWRRAWCATRLIDNADALLSLTRSKAWLHANVDVAGAWPATDPFLAITSHWGGGMWALRHLRDTGHRARMLVRRAEAASGDRLLASYLKLRIRAIEHALGTKMIYTGKATEEIMRTLDSGISVVALFDVPPERSRGVIRVPFLDGEIAVPAGLLRLACDRRIPVAFFSGELERTTGRRALTIGKAQPWGDPAQLAAMLATELQALLTRDSAAWHLWPFADELLVERSA